MDLKKNKLLEKMMLFLYAVSITDPLININTFKRYLYLYYLTLSFLNEGEEDDPINIVINKGDISIIFFEDNLREMNNAEYISIEGNTIQVNDQLRNYLMPLLKQENGRLLKQYREILPFVNILQSYSDQYIFTIFFREPTFISATQRGLNEIKSSDSLLNKLLVDFKERVRGRQDSVDEYDMLSYWMDFILKNYYTGKGETNGGE